jgi:hypothetical protein
VATVFRAKHALNDENRSRCLGTIPSKGSAI